MNLDEALRCYRRDFFTDEEVTRCTGLSQRAWRELIRNKAVRTVTEGRGRGRVRLCDRTILKRSAAITALNRAGLSLAVSGQIVYFLPFHTLLYEICDPFTILFERSAVLDPTTELPPRLQEPKADWFDPSGPARTEPETDWLIEIYDGRFVGIKYGPKDMPFIFGDLRDAGTCFVAWVPLHAKDQFAGSGIDKIAKELVPFGIVDFVADWEDPVRWYRELNLIGYKYEKHDSDDDPLRAAAEAAVDNPLFTVKINISLSIRKALRRYLGIEPLELNSENRQTI